MTNAPSSVSAFPQPEILGLTGLSVVLPEEDGVSPNNPNNISSLTLEDIAAPLSASPLIAYKSIHLHQQLMAEVLFSWIIGYYFLIGGLE